jgi:hypothetical protein
MENRTENTWKIFNNQQDLIRLFDTKVNVLLVISGITTSFLLVNLKEIIETGAFGKILFGLFVVFFALFVVFALLTIFPRKPTKSGRSIPKLIYFKDIASRVEAKDYVEDFEKTTDKELQNDLYYQIYELASIVKLKSENYYKAWIFLILQFIVFTGVLIVMNFTNG